MAADIRLNLAASPGWWLLRYSVPGRARAYTVVIVPITGQPIVSAIATDAATHTMPAMKAPTWKTNIRMSDIPKVAIIEKSNKMVIGRRH